MSDRFPEQMLQAGDNNLDPIADAKLNFYVTTTTTRKDTYSDDAKTVPNLNPVVADAAGRFGDIFMDTDVPYKVVYTDAADVVIQTFDPYDPVRATNVVETPVTTKSSNFSVLESERGHLYEIDASAGSINATLLQASVAANNFEIGFKKVDSSANAVTVDGFGAETIDDETEQVLANKDEVIVLVCDGTRHLIKSDNRSVTAALPRDYVSNIVFANNSIDPNHDIDIPAHETRDSADGVNIENATDLTKQADAAWSPGSNQGGLSSSLTLAADTTYYIFDVIINAAADVGFDTDPDAANLIADHSATAYRQIGSFRTKAASANIIEDRFMTVTTHGKRFDFNTEATTSGTAFDFDGIDPDVRRMTLQFQGVSLDASDDILVQIGDSGGLEVAGYNSTSVQTSGAAGGGATNTTGFAITLGTGTAVFSGHMVLTKMSGNLWISSHSGKLSTTLMVGGGGDKTLSDVLDRVRITRAGASNFDAGSVSILAED